LLARRVVAAIQAGRSGMVAYLECGEAIV